MSLGVCVHTCDWMNGSKKERTHSNDLFSTLNLQQSAKQLGVRIISEEQLFDMIAKVRDECVCVCVTVHVCAHMCASRIEGQKERDAAAASASLHPLNNTHVRSHTTISQHTQTKSVVKQEPKKEEEDSKPSSAVPAYEPGAPPPVRTFA